MALAVGQAASAAPPEAPPVWVQVSSALECPRPAPVLDALRQRLGGERVRTDEAPSGALLLRVEAEGPAGVTASLSQAASTIVERRLMADADECASLAETVALVASSWLPLAEGPAPEPVHAAIESPAAAAKAATARAQADAEAAGEPTTVPVERSSPPPFALALDLALGSALGLDAIAAGTTDESPRGLARAGAELSFLPWHVGARTQLETPDDLDPLGAITVVRWNLEALLGADVHRSERWALVATLAAGADLLIVTDRYTRPAGPLLAPSAAAGLRGEWRAVSSVDLTAAIEGVVALRRDHFESWHTPRARARFTVGALWHL